MQAAIDGSEEVWSAILASTLTHIAVFVPLLFLSGVSSVLFIQLSVVVMFSLSMSLFVAVTVVPVLCSRLLKLPKPESERTGVLGRLFTTSEHMFRRLDDFYRSAIHLALQHRPTVVLAATALTAFAFLVLPTIPTELVPQTDEGEVSVSARLPVGIPNRAGRSHRASGWKTWCGRTCQKSRRSSRTRAAAGSAPAAAVRT